MVVSREVESDAASFRLEKHMEIRNMWFIDGTQIRIFPPIRIEFDSIHQNGIDSIEKCPSSIRALGNERSMKRSYYCMIRTAVR